MEVFYVAFGGFFGSILRFGLASSFKKHPIGTWIANISGSLLLAILIRVYQAGMIDPWLWLFAGVGFCGAYTTFSTFSNEVLVYVMAGKLKNAILYVGSSLISALVIVFVILMI